MSQRSVDSLSRTIRRTYASDEHSRSWQQKDLSLGKSTHSVLLLQSLRITNKDGVLSLKISAFVPRTMEVKLGRSIPHRARQNPLRMTNVESLSSLRKTNAFNPHRMLFNSGKSAHETSVSIKPSNTARFTVANTQPPSSTLRSFGKSIDHTPSNHTSQFQRRGGKASLQISVLQTADGDALQRRTVLQTERAAGQERCLANLQLLQVLQSDNI